VSQHVHSTISSCAQHLYALRVLRAHVFRAVVITKVCYTSSAWCGFTSAADRQHLKAFHSRLCAPDQPDLTKLVELIDDTLFQRILKNDNYLLFSLLLMKSDIHYKLRNRHHDRQH